MSATDPTSCETCGRPIEQPNKQGRRRRTCSPLCRQALYRAESYRAQHGRWPSWWRGKSSSAGQHPTPRNKKR